MRINIFGVGRSGTKVVQLYIAYLLAKKYGKVRINYEPYFWHSPKGQVSFEGLHHHLNSPQFIESSKLLSKEHKEYLKGLVDTPDGIPTVTKFIRGNGRIGAINEITKPDLTIIVVRNLYEVLSSICQMDWDFYSVGYSYFKGSYRSFLKSYKTELKGQPFFSNHEDIIPEKSDRVLDNALYWYGMNKAALNLKDPKNILYLNYSQIVGFGERLKSYLPEIEIEPIEREKFEGANIHSNYPLEETQSERFPPFQLTWNELQLYLPKKIKLPIFKKPNGVMAKVSSSPHTKRRSEDKPTKVIISPNETLEFFNKSVRDDLTSKLF